MSPASTPRLWSRLTSRGRRWAGWMLADLELLAAVADLAVHNSALPPATVAAHFHARP